MGLAAYKKKRRFDKTPEPGPKISHTESGFSFVIQKHAASHLHYDFRLELDGTLKSWAVPKGPSLDPGEKRLAMEVEDHPVSYRDFEGLIPKGEYGGGTVIVWDKGTWAPHGDPKQMLARGRLSFDLTGKKLQGGFSLVRMHGKDDKKPAWLLMKSSDDHARPGSGADIVQKKAESVLTGRTIEEVAKDGKSATWHSNRAEKAPKKRAHKSPASPIPGPKEKMPDFSPPTLATLVSSAPDGTNWFHEVKYDGYRALLHVTDGACVVHTRSGQDWTDRFAGVAEAAAALPVSQAILDGEIVSLRADGVSDFGALQSAMGSGGGGSLVCFVFDILHLDGKNLRGLPLRDRKKLLEELFARASLPPVLRLSQHVEGRGAEMHKSACSMGLEGIVSKRADSTYEGGRGKSWLKVKCQKRQELVVGGFTDPGGGRSGLGALLVGYYDGHEGLVYAGKVGTGFDTKTLEQLRSRLTPLEVQEAPFLDPPRAARAHTHWVKPITVVEVEHTEWTKDGKLRHPSFKGLREDKKAREVRREMPSTIAPEAAKTESATVPAGTTSTTRTRKKDDTIEVAGVRISNASKLLYPEEGVTKGDVARFYDAIADEVLPHVADRPLTLVRCPDGYAKTCFYQKHAGAHAPASLKRVKLNPGEDDYVYIDSKEGLISLVQMGVLELHVWGSHVDTFEKPDLFVLDLDPAVDLPWASVVEGARDLRKLLTHLGLTSFVKTTGGKGLHVVVPLLPKLSWDEVKDFTKSIADTLVKVAPDRYTSNMSKAKRPGKIFLDYLRNGRGATAVSAYSTRARSGATVAVPMAWEDIARIKPETLTTKTVPKLLERRKDPWADFFTARQAVTRDMIRALDKALLTTRSSMKHTIPHDVETSLARKAAHKAFETYQAKFAEYRPSVVWTDEDHAIIGFHVKGMSIKGSVALRPEAVDLDLDVPFVLKIFQKRALSIIETEVREWLEKAKLGEI